MSDDKKKFFEQQIEANKPAPQPKTEKVWKPTANNTTGAHDSTGFKNQTVNKKVMPKPSGEFHPMRETDEIGPPPAPKNIGDLP
ncbi:hypothetical protein PROFUN_06075 [Planoprotostelium fungivorum]|uniref:Uncharacterized protein n=1 Tax=Planoprotostelium fungivorum TaxID=1890364 RepID=A0A2P6NPS6_9EUKA|nr:hypothetical protein PROFUN_06075 [Planoprotostelium fungivorum]